MNLDKKINASLAFVFNEDLTKVLLIKKTKPIQHAGLLNGLGGKREKSESNLSCVIREVYEESGVMTQKSVWLKVGKMAWSNWHVTIWTCRVDATKLTLSTTEKTAWYSTISLPENVIENLRWLIPLSMDLNRKSINQESSLPLVNIHYSSTL